MTNQLRLFINWWVLGVLSVYRPVYIITYVKVIRENKLCKRKKIINQLEYFLLSPSDILFSDHFFIFRIIFVDGHSCFVRESFSSWNNFFEGHSRFARERLSSWERRARAPRFFATLLYTY